MNKRFALIGAGGYVAPRHMRAIKETGNDLLSALDIHDSVGILDSYFPKAAFFVEFERFDRHIDKLKRSGKKIDYLSICSPNYLHDAHVRFGLRNQAHAICEKPLVLNPWSVDSLAEIEQESDKKIYTILQLRLHPSVIELKKKVKSNSDKIWDVDLTYITSRGNWYYASWKGDEIKSGGICTNIGIHFFDMLIWVFGEVTKNVVNIISHDRAAGYLELKNARVRWFLSINSDLLSDKTQKDQKTTFRSLTIDNEAFEFSGGFDDLHTASYKQILNNEGFGIEEARKAIIVTHQIRNQKPVGISGEYHALAVEKLTKHPFLR